MNFSKQKRTVIYNGHKMRKNGRLGRSGPAHIDVGLLSRKPIQVKDTTYESAKTFNDSPLHEKLKLALARRGYRTPTEIQDKSLDLILAGHDLVGMAKTGTGKTGAFLIPIIHQMLTRPQSVRALVLVPTRELAVQVSDEFRLTTQGLGLSSSTFIGGTSVSKDLTSLRRNSDLVVGTPGRLLDLINRKQLRLRNFSTLVIDEFDRMLDMGFINDVKKITAEMENRSQTMLFSATIDESQSALIKGMLRNPIEVRLSSGKNHGEHIEQDIVRVPVGGDKFEVLLQLLYNKGEFRKVLVFAETKRLVSKLYMKLKKADIKADEIHGDKAQNKRLKTIVSFERGDIQVLVATDVASRGLDVADISHVINYEIPKNYEDYIHRIGRTGRAGSKGKAITLVASA